MNELDVNWISMKHINQQERKAFRENVIEFLLQMDGQPVNSHVRNAEKKCYDLGIPVELELVFVEWYNKKFKSKSKKYDADLKILIRTGDRSTRKKARVNYLDQV